MSGVFRAKSCLSCRATKRRCDRKQPICSMCEQKGFTCRYQKRPDLTFITHVHQLEEQPKAVRRSAKPRVILDALPLQTYHLSLERTAFEDHLLGHFLSVCLPVYNCQSSELGRAFDVRPNLSYLQDARAISQSSYRVAVSACCLALLSRRHGNELLRRISMQVYGKALQQTRSVIARLKPGHEFGIIASCRLLSLYEMMRPESEHDPMFTQELSWRVHEAAASKIARPSDLTESLRNDDRSLYVELQSMTSRARFSARCLNDPWPDSDVHLWSWYSADSSLSQRLSNLMAQAMSLVRHGDNLLFGLRQEHEHQTESAVPESYDRQLTMSKCQETVDGLMGLDKALAEWEMDITTLHAVDELVIATTQPLFMLLSFSASTYTTSSTSNATAWTAGTAHSRDHLWSACASHGYGFLLAVNELWATRIIILRQVQRMIEATLDDRFEDMLHIMNTPDTLLDNVCKCIWALLQPEAGLWVSEHATYSIATAIYTLSAGGEGYAERLHQLQTIIDGVKGSAFSFEFIRSMVIPPAKRSVGD